MTEHELLVRAALADPQGFRLSDRAIQEARRVGISLRTARHSILLQAWERTAGRDELVAAAIAASPGLWEQNTRLILPVSSSSVCWLVWTALEG
ncbi:hypothetical protein [Microtetraspora sp. NBRC 13810]|uniref:hypothetical protein n=1 Tax=Microtetraspora sp. NBRC 13810 TaxID=3030990 RepID=UPI0025539D97|nr:hypothetical protein [Microtetraspora sp. NBRC 13810]